MVAAASNRSGALQAPCALITGAASGIGLAAARNLIAAGWTIWGLDRHPVPPDLAIDGWTICDLNQPDMVDTCIASLAGQQWSAIISCAGIAGVGEIESILRINFFAARRLVDALAPQVKNGGTIILISSGAGMQWTKQQSSLRAVIDAASPGDSLLLASDLCHSPSKAYEVSKQLLCFYGAYTCLSHWARGVRVNVVSPGGVETPLADDFSRSMGTEAMAFSLSVTGRYAQPDEIADVVRFLASPQARWINGAEIRVDGGLTGALTAGVVRFEGWE